MKIDNSGKGIILRKIRTKENDQTVVIFSEEFGKIWLLAKGAQKINSKRLPCLDSLNFVNFSFTNRTGLNFLKEISLISALEQLKIDYQKKRTLLLIIEILDKILPIGQKEAQVFELTKEFLVLLNKQKDGFDDLLLITIKRLMVILGYGKPNFSDISFNSLNNYLESIVEKRLYSTKL